MKAPEEVRLSTLWCRTRIEYEGQSTDKISQIGLCLGATQPNRWGKSDSPLEPEDDSDNDGEKSSLRGVKFPNSLEQKNEVNRLVRKCKQKTYLKGSMYVPRKSSSPGSFLLRSSTWTSDVDVPWQRRLRRVGDAL